MQGARDNFFSGAMLTGDENVGVGRADAGNGIENRLHERSGGNELGTSLGLQQAILGSQPFGALQGAAKVDLGADDGEQARILPGLLDEITGAAAHGLDREFNVRPRGHDNDGNGVVEADNFGKQVEPFLPRGRVSGVVQVDEQGIVEPCGQRIANQRGGSRGLHFISLRTQQEFESFENVLLIVGGQDAGPLEAGLYWANGGWADSSRARGGGSSWFGGSLHGGLWARGADVITHRAGHCILELDAIMFQSGAGCAIKFDFCFFEDGHRGDQVEFREREITLGRAFDSSIPHPGPALSW
jgi:hypothetical protein